jgi:hypothetical protein
MTEYVPFVRVRSGPIFRNISHMASHLSFQLFPIVPGTFLGRYDAHAHIGRLRRMG